MWGGGLWSAAEGRPWLPGAAEETGAVGGQTASVTWAGTAHLPEQKETVHGSVCCQAQTHRRSLWRTCSDTVCASSRDGCFLAARNTSGGVNPGRGVRNSGQVKLYLGEQTAKVVWQFLLTHDL